MAERKPFDFDISVAAAKRRRARSRGMSGAFETADRRCDHPGCAREARYRAPKSPDRLNEFYWFCLDHVRDYNRQWNFFGDATDAEIEAQFERDRVWDRATRPFRESVVGRGTQPHAEGRSWARFGLDDPQQILGEKGTRPAPEPARRRLPPTERRALDILDCAGAQTKAEVRRHYKSLVKDLHPDMNGGRRDDEDRLALVVWAWEQIRASRALPD